MATNSKYTIVKKGTVAGGDVSVKQYSNSSYVAKKTELARETLRKYPVPKEYCK